MADILIKNMEMPQGDDRKVIVIESDGSVWQGIGTTAYFCTGDNAVALSEHGDLIDEDEFRQVIYREIRNHKEDEPITMILKGILWEMDNAPVIVEANNGHTD